MVSLIVATVNRVAELERLLASLDQQSYADFEVIVIDQNGDDRLVPVLAAHRDLRVRHLRSESGAGRARNVGLRVATGAIIAFPDDDCWYPPTLLESIVGWLAQHRQIDAVFTTVRDAENQPVGPRWPAQGCTISKANCWNTAIFVNAFLRCSVIDAVGLFREDIGVGASTPYQSGEESDFFLRALALGFAMQYQPSYVVHHPNLHSPERLRRTAYSYALGCGYVLRLHGYSLPEFGNFLARSLGGAVVNLAQANMVVAYTYLLRAAGQFRGYFWGSRDLARLRAKAG